MRIVFIANQTKTEYFHAIARGVELAGHPCFWITPSHRWGNWLTKKNVDRTKILDITSYSDEWVSSQDLDEESIGAIAKLEQCSGLTINNLILMDRLLYKRPYQYAWKYLATIQKYIESFLVSNQIDVVFAEHSWAIELLTYQICTKLRIPTFAPNPVRIPDRRFAFFPGYLQSEIAEIREVKNEDYQIAKAFYLEYLERKPKPSDYYLLKKELKFFTFDWEKQKNRFRYIWERVRFAKEYSFDETKPSLSSLVSSSLMRIANTQKSIITKPFIRVENIKDKRPFVLLTLHLQPEISIDIFGAYFSNQIELVKTLARSLPITHDLYVKEHSCAIGSRSLIDYKQIKSIPGVYLIDPSADTFRLLAEADLVISISGTTLYEAGIFGKPAVSIAPMFFGSLLTSNGMNPYEIPLSRVLDTIRTQQNSDTSKGEKQINFLAWIIAQSFPGEIGCPLSNPNSMSDDNIKNVTKGFLIFLDNYTKQRSIKKGFFE